MAHQSNQPNNQPADQHNIPHKTQPQTQVETLSARVLLFLGDDPAHTLKLFTGPTVGAD